jgi:hypothetical protein
LKCKSPVTMNVAPTTVRATDIPPEANAVP